MAREWAYVFCALFRQNVFSLHMLLSTSLSHLLQQLELQCLPMEMTQKMIRVPQFVFFVTDREAREGAGAGG